MPRNPGTDLDSQKKRFDPTFNRLAKALADDNGLTLSSEPFGIAPERTLVFVAGSSIQNFVNAAKKIGLEVISEEAIDEYLPPEDSYLSEGAENTAPTLYATIPTLEVLRSIVSLWSAYTRDEAAPTGAAPWWNLFKTLAEIRPWGPQDRFPEGVRNQILDRLPFDEHAQVHLEIELWPTRSLESRMGWQHEIAKEVVALGGEVLDKSSINEPNFIYEAVLIALPCHAVKEILDAPGESTLIRIDGVQFVLPQTVAESIQPTVEVTDELPDELLHFTDESSYNALLLDGTPVAAHELLDGGVDIADIHGLVARSEVSQREHATSMASLILRGDISADNEPLSDTKLISVPILVDEADSARSPRDRLLVDIVHIALQSVLEGDDPIAPDVFVVNMAVGIVGSEFAGRVSSLARLLDWWSAETGVLFVVSAGNTDLSLPLEMTFTEFDDATYLERHEAVEKALSDNAFERTLLAPAESVNALTVGGLSQDLDAGDPTGATLVHELGATVPAFSSAIGPGINRCIKPDILMTGGLHEVAAIPSEGQMVIGVRSSPRTGINAASAGAGSRGCRKTRGTSVATALTTRSILKSLSTLTGDGGPLEQVELDIFSSALITKALIVNAARWPDTAHALYEKEKTRLGSERHYHAKELVLRQYGFGAVDAVMLMESPVRGVTLVGTGTIRKDGAEIFELPLPKSLAGTAVERRMQVTLAWFSPVSTTRTTYRLAALDAVASDSSGEDDEDHDKEWFLGMKSDLLAENLVSKSSVWSRRLVHKRRLVSDYDNDTTIPIRVQCRDASSGALDPDKDIPFAIVVTLALDAEVEFDIHNEILQKIKVPVRT